jgi:hypothetical protein
MLAWKRAAAMTSAATLAAVLGAAAPAYASKNVGWLYTLDYSGAVFFDADLNGVAGVEKITVCDNVADGYGVGAFVAPLDDLDPVVTVYDPSSDGSCESVAYNMFKEETPVTVQVWNYRHGLGYNRNVDNSGVA